MNTVFNKETLEYYDCVLIFEAADDTGRVYIAAHNKETRSGCEYTVVPVDRSKMLEFKTGMIDLRELMLHNPERPWYITEMTAGPNQMTLQEQDSTVEHCPFLPKQGIYLDRLDWRTDAHNTAVELGRAAMQVRLVSRANQIANRTNEMSASIFANIVNKIASSLKELSNEISPTGRAGVNEINIVGNPVAGSIIIKMVAVEQTNLWGDNNSISAMESLTQFLLLEATEPEVGKFAENRKGKSLKELRSLASDLGKGKIDINVEWSAGRADKAGEAFLNSEKAGEVAKIVNKIKKETTQSVTIEGILDAVSVRGNSWTIITDEKETKKGTIAKPGGPSLNGRTTGQRYSIQCTEITDEMSENEKPRLIANSMAEVMS